MTDCIEYKGCFKLCKSNGDERDISKSLLLPPRNANYSIFPNSGIAQCTQISFRNFSYDSLQISQYIWIKEYSYLLKKDNNNSIVILHLRNNNNQHIPKRTILYSHESGTTLGYIYPFLYDFSTQLRCDIIAYDYSGYGRSEGSSSEEEMKSDIKEVYNFICNTIPDHEILLFGHSIGSIPSVNLSFNQPSVLGMILMSPISSGLRTISEKSTKKSDSYIDWDDEIKNQKTKSFYFFNILNKITNPVFLIHGMLDNEIPQFHSMDIAKRLINVSQWYPKNGTHTNILETRRDKFYKKIREFINLSLKYKEMYGTKNIRVNPQENIVNSSEEKKWFGTYNRFQNSVTFNDDSDSKAIYDSSSENILSNQKLDKSHSSGNH